MSVSSRRRPRSSDSGMAPATLSESDGIRYLHLGTPWVQGAMRIAKPQLLQLEYIQRMMAWTLLCDPDGLADGQAVQLGLGAGAITRFCHGVLGMRCTAVEINPSVVSVCRQFFRVPEDDERLNVWVGDAAAYVADPLRRDSVQALQVDLYDHDAAAPVLDDEGFYQDCHRLLGEGGVMAVNLFGAKASFQRSASRIAASFGASMVRSLQPTKEGNTIVLALKAPTFPEASTLAERAQSLETRFSLPAGKWLRMIRSLSPEPDPA